MLLSKPPLAPGKPRACSKFMASSAKKKNSKSPAKKSSSPKAKAPAKSSKSPQKTGGAAKKPAARETKKDAAHAGKSPKANGARKSFGSDNASHEILATKDQKQRKLDPFVRGQKDKLLQLRDA